MAEKWQHFEDERATRVGCNFLFKLHCVHCCVLLMMLRVKWRSKIDGGTRRFDAAEISSQTTTSLLGDSR